MTIQTQTAICPAILKSMYVSMVLIRCFEESIAGYLSLKHEIGCPVHLYTGQEAVAVGVCQNLQREDWVFSTHRSHGHYLAKGGDRKALAAELWGKSTGCSGGKGGSMHISQPGIGLPGSSAIVAGTIPEAVGAALTFQLQHRNNVAVAFFGDGATGAGGFYESLNFAALKKLPVVFVCENNLYSTHMPVGECLAQPEIWRHAEAFGMPGARIDGNDVVSVYMASSKAIEQARRGDGPALLECMTYRWHGHVGANADLDKGLRNQFEYNQWLERCPIKTFERELMAEGLLDEPERARIYQAVQRDIEDAIEFARDSPYPNESEAAREVFKEGESVT